MRGNSKKVPLLLFHSRVQNLRGMLFLKVRHHTYTHTRASAFLRLAVNCVVCHTGAARSGARNTFVFGRENVVLGVRGK